MKTGARALCQALLMLAAGGTSARAGAADPAAGPAEVEPPAVSAAPGTRRPIPDYDGRAPEPPGVGKSLIWIPRVVLLPAHLLVEYGLRRPLVAGVTWGEQHHVWPRLQRVFTWDQRRGGVYPLFELDLGLPPTMGVALYARSADRTSSYTRLTVSFASPDLVDSTAASRIALGDGPGAVLQLRARYARRSGGLYHLPAAAGRADDRLQFSYQEGRVDVGTEWALGGMNRTALLLGLRRLAFEVGAPELALPPGFEGYNLASARLSTVLDSRPAAGGRPPGSGWRLEADANPALSPGDSDLSFAVWGLAAAGFLDVSGVGHTLGLELCVRGSERLGSRPIPFYELPSLGGSERLRGFPAGWLRGRSLAVLSAQYRYPVWSFLDGELFAGLGNVFPGHLNGLSPRRLYADTGLGLRTSFSPDVSLAFTAAVGSRRLDDPSFRLIDTVRLVFGINHGF